MPGPCRPIELSIPLCVSHPRGRPPGALGRHDRLRDDRAELGHVEVMREFTARPGAARRGGGWGWAARRAPAWRPQVSRHRPAPGCWLPACRPAAGRGCVPACCVPACWGPRRGRVPDPGAPSASNGIVSTSPQRTESPWKTGPSTQDRTILGHPCSPRPPGAHRSCRPRSRRPWIPRPGPAPGCRSGPLWRSPGGASPVRAEGEDHVGPGLVNDLAQDVSDQPAHTHRAILGGDRRGPPAARWGR